ncbi:MAG: succinate dehydrogenase, hydrophobic membrane anchor protein [Roseitalea sp.]|jgi:succinate dehydrogenase / fumarate reductase membrane anchor subunit|uniref:Succinate dehydrogenase hydrophobic membrane anchor subunit n=1 Tax=Oceaniradius stylonematis TaxID=2184161 RepID=A0A3A8ANU7_9HYPH|nr:succinate dehydrogenase, hydrophobic membrane anchor protein [Oceaniradius stylonematis]MBO6554053.1 succinate dehydrogenase, hydrophobic membrane anchor protein [Roseitalea sp.]MBO6952823.1 succinate dehydrogenase, hydrophobic membrane anchor protein [Rhizobiaceae bacterium]RNC96723.1 MAG: succinate dehydrogenase, hydrophobic membrane anchor protein [Oricola sp.]MBO6593170.1 succinate dehydrogenase, hydrophobic membrane anchor protein [Roseitalea sp.]MBO6600840.1 succinate dehydrogenase, h
MSIKTPFKRVEGLGSAKDGTEHFWRQRLTALANVPLIIAFVWIVVSLNGEDHATVAATFANPFVAVVMLLVIVSALYHAKLGMQVVIEDYIHGELAKYALLVANIFFTFGIAVLAVFAILKMGFGS